MMPNHAAVAFVRSELSLMHQHRQQIGLDARLYDCLLQRLGMYPADTLAKIRSVTKGSTIYLELTQQKCRAAAAMLRELFITNERPWTIDPTPVPDIDGPTVEEIAARARMEIEQLSLNGVQLTPEQIQSYIQRRFEAGMREQRDMAERRSETASRFIDDILQEGGFYDALSQFIDDFVTYPLAILTGPRPVMQSSVRWVNGDPVVEFTPKLRWSRVDPQDFWWSPGARSIEMADVVERMPISRAALEALIDMPGYNSEEVRAVLRTYGATGWRAEVASDSFKQRLENQPATQHPYGAFDLLIYTGRLTGRKISDLGLDIEGVKTSDTRSWLVTLIVCGDYLLKTQADPDPLQRTGYYVASYDPVPNSIVGCALPELFKGPQEAVNAIGRALLNNVAMASGPQVVVNVDALPNPGADISVAPWKTWLVSTINNAAPPVTFFQPGMNGQELSSLLMLFWSIADDVSGVPRYLGGSEKVGGAGRTASGLAMLMGNSTRVLQLTASSIDNCVLGPSLQKLYRLLMLTAREDSPLRGDETIIPKGATYAKAREADRMRMLEFLSLSANPIDLKLLGPEVRASLLMKVAKNIGLDIPYDTLRSVIDRTAAMEQQEGPQPVMEDQPQPQPQTQGPMPAPGRSALVMNAGKQMPPAEGLSNPGVDQDTRRMLEARGVRMGPLSRRG